jgi:hypothetical protein
MHELARERCCRRTDAHRPRTHRRQSPHIPLQWG